MDRYLLRDEDEGFYNVILFNEKIDILELEKLIYNHKKRNFGEWNIGTITDEIIEKYNVKELLLFDYLRGNTGDICGDEKFKNIKGENN